MRVNVCLPLIALSLRSPRTGTARSVPVSRTTKDPRDTTNPDRVPVCQGAMGHVHARVQEIRGHRGIPDKTEDTDRPDSKVDSMDKDRTGIQEKPWNTKAC